MRAASAAPEEIKDDFRVVVAAQLPLLSLLADAKADGDFATIASRPEFQQAIQQLANPTVATASAKVNSWFATNCPVE